MPTRLLLAMFFLVTAMAHAVPDPSPLPDGVFYGIRMISAWYGGNQLLRIEPDGAVEVVAPLWDDDGALLFVEQTLTWHPMYKRLFAFDSGTRLVGIGPNDGHIESLIDWENRWVNWADLGIIPNDPRLYALCSSGDIVPLDPRLETPPEVELHERGCRDFNPESRPRGIAYIDRPDIPQAGFYIRYSDCPLGALNLLAAPDRRSYWIGAPLPGVRGLFWDPGTQRLYEWDQVYSTGPPPWGAPCGPVQFWTIDPITGDRQLAFQWELDFDLVALDFVPSTDTEIIDCLPADITGDNEIDLRDFAALQNCMTEPAAPPFNP